MLWLIVAIQVTISPITARIAKSASVEPLSNSVAVFLEEEEPAPRKGLEIAVVTQSKFSTVIANQIGGRSVPLEKTKSGKWLLFGPQGVYNIIVIESDPEKGLNVTTHEGVIGEVVPPPVTDTGFVEAVRKVVKEIADPTTAKQLAQAYTQVANSGIAELEPMKQAAITARRAVLLSRTDFNTKWNLFLDAITPTLNTALTAEQYKGLLLQVVKGLE